jgi:cell division transport system ATP-binding protein
MILRAFNLIRQFPSGGGVKGVDLEIAPGDFTVLTGVSGAGKTTLLKLLSLCEIPEKGHLLLDDVSSKELKRSEFHRWRRKIGVIPQELTLLRDRTVFHNVYIPLRAVGLTIDKSKRSALKALAKVGLSHKLREKAGYLSGGEARRVAIARAIANEPFLLLADEPLGDLDTETGREILNLFERINALGTAIFMVTHRQDLQPACKFSRYRMESGKLFSL